MHKPLPRLLVASVVAIGCGKKPDSPATVKDDAGTAGKPTVAPLVMPALGVDRPTRFGYGPGSPDYLRARGNYPKWAAVLTGCENAIAKDPSNLEAHWLLAGALAQTGDNAAAVEHVVIALGGDYLYYGANLTTDDLKDLLASPHGKSISELATRIGADYDKRIAGGIFVVARRGPWHWPDHHDVQPDWPRGEVYSYDRETKRYLRVTHTEHQVAGFVRSGSELALVGFDRVDYPSNKDDAPLIQRGWVQVVSARDGKQLGPRAILPTAREIALGYTPEGQLLVSTAPATARWTVGDATVSTLDKTTGKLTKLAATMPAEKIVVTLDDVRASRVPAGITAAWTGDPVIAPNLSIGGGAVTIPESGKISQASVALAPDGTRVAFATAVDPCAKDVAPSLYVGDTKHAPHHILTANSRFVTQWIDATTLAYDDGDGSIRLWDAPSLREIGRLEDHAGIALDVLAIVPGQECRSSAPDTGSGSNGPGSDDLPPEEGPNP